MSRDRSSSPFNLDRFLADMSETYAIEITNDPFAEVSLNTLPSRPTVVVLRPQFLRDAIE